MTATLLAALKALSVVRTGLVVRNDDGTAIGDGQASHTSYRICRKAGLPEEGWHRLRHSFGTRAARFGVNPWRLQKWMGHKRIDETMRYVHVAEERERELAEVILQAGEAVRDPDRWVLAMLAARSATTESRVAVAAGRP